MGVQNDFVIKDGVLETYEGAGGSVRIPDGVSKIADSAFSRCSGVTEVVVPDRVTEICSHAFFLLYGPAEGRPPFGAVRDFRGDVLGVRTAGGDSDSGACEENRRVCI